MTQEDKELILQWFNHIAQIADDRKTLNGEIMEERTCYSVPNPYFLSDRFVYAHHKELGTVYIKLNCSEEIEDCKDFIFTQDKVKEIIAEEG